MPVTERGRVAAQSLRRQAHRQAATAAVDAAAATPRADSPAAQAFAAQRVGEPRRTSPKVMRASGARIDSSNPDAVRSLVAGRRSQQWQALAWGYRDMIGELRYGLQYRARAISRVRFYVAQIIGDDDEPIPLSLRSDDDAEKRGRITLPPALCAAAEEELARLPLDAGYQFTGVWSENFDVAGECYLHGFYDAWSGEEQWKIRSVDEVEFGTDGRTVHLIDETVPGGIGRRVDLSDEGGEELYRLWVPHPRRSHLADSALHAMIGTMEDICLIGREMRAVMRSRIMANGVILMPDGMTMMRNTREDGDGDEDDSPFMAEFTEAINAPIANEGDPGGTVPVVLTGSIEDIKAWRHERLEREDSEELKDKLEAALGRLGAGLDIPPEILKGMGDANHWTAWQIDSSTARHHIEPGVRLMADSLTGAMLRAALLKRGFPIDQVRQVRVWYDLGSLTENPNRRQDAIDARREGAIGNASFRKALGFNDGDAPTPQEVIEMVALKAGFDQATATAILRALAANDPEQPFEFPAGTEPVQPRALPQGAPPAAPVGPGNEPGSVPSTAPPAIAASGRGSALTRIIPGQVAYDGLSGTALATVPSGQKAAPAEEQYRLALEESRRLTEVDRTLRDTLLAACDAAMTRALEVAGARLRGKATADPKLSADLRGLNVLVLGQHIGRERALALNADDDHLLREAFAQLGTLFTKWVLSAIENVVDRVLQLLGLDAESRAGRAAAKRMRDGMGSRVDDGWARLLDGLRDRASTLLFDGEDDEDLPGELPPGAVPPHLLRTALAIVGGLPETSGGLDEFGRSVTGEPVGGLANGDTVRREMEQHGAVELGYLWVYGITLDPRKFDPHWDLEGAKFADWSDPKLETAAVYGGKFAWVGTHFRPGDHRGCMCDYVPAYAVPAYAEQVRERLAVPTREMADLIALAESDDAAGRKGTTAQIMRDQHQQIQTLQARFLGGKRP